MNALSLEECMIFNASCKLQKRIIDIIITIPVIILLSPLMIIILIIVRIDSPGNPIFSQVRIGRYGKYFTMYKIRTLYIEHFGNFIEQEQPHSYRITKVGKFLRSSKIDEIPQLINVFLGQMSLVGPRPDVPINLQNYISSQYNRFLVKPGLTGIAQVSGNTLLSWPERILLDLWYIKSWKILLDIKIMLLTFKSIFSKKHKQDPFSLYQYLFNDNQNND